MGVARERTLRPVERNPEFERNSGRVSILGHSLGSVIAFDMLTGMHINEFTSLSTEEPDDDDELCRVRDAVSVSRSRRRPVQD